MASGAWPPLPVTAAGVTVVVGKAGGAGSAAEWGSVARCAGGRDAGGRRAEARRAGGCRAGGRGAQRPHRAVARVLIRAYTDSSARRSPEWSSRDVRPPKRSDFSSVSGMPAVFWVYGVAPLVVRLLRPSRTGR